METLDNTEWDVLIVGTGLQQSLLALYATIPRAGDGRDLTDSVFEELCRARTKKFSTSTRMTTTAVLKLLSVCRKRKSGRGEQTKVGKYMQRSAGCR
jgi:hypothetical protein